MRALVFTPTTLFRLSQFEISEDWFFNFNLPPEVQDIKRTNLSGIIYFIETTLDRDDGPIIVIDASGENPVFRANHPNRSILEKIITVGRSTFTNSVKIPTNWCGYHEKNLLSVYAHSRKKGSGERINFDTRPNNDNALYVYALTPEARELSKIPRDLDLYSEARNNLASAVLEEKKSLNDNGRAGIVLSTRLPQGFVQGSTLEQWYDSKLTQEQRSFVDKLHDGPVRLRGSAGTGKTLSLVIKALRDGHAAEKSGYPKKFGFITHSVASVDMVSAITESLDPIGLISGQGQHCKIELRTLYDLAHQHLKFNLDELKPLSLDGREGKILQRELINSILIEMRKSPVLRLQFGEGKISPDIYNKWGKFEEQKDARFVIEIMNEFASVLDAESIRSGDEKGEKYARGTFHRASWLIPLPLEMDRRFMLEVHRRYRSELSDMNTLSVDQMVADFNSFLDSNRWDNLRARAGYDALFVDELHLFTSIERQTLHKLIKKSVDEEGRQIRPPIFMAYDLKQSPNDAFASQEGGKNIFSASSKLQNSDLVKLEKVFRYTPEISDFLADLDASFPAVDIPDEWNAYSGKAQLSNGERPKLKLYDNEAALFDSVMNEARQIARTIEGGGRRVAVLCVSDEMFDRYSIEAKTKYENIIFSIDSREPSSELRHAGKRFVFSMPEYVAGLQFDTVFLLHVDSADAPTDASLGLRRRFISNVYLGASRAEKRLTICSCLNRGGVSEILNMAQSRGSLEREAV